MIYPIVIHKDENSDFGVTVPDLPGCFSSGETFEKAIKNVREAIYLHLEGMIDDGERIPVALDVEEHYKNDEYRNGIWAIVEIDVSKLSNKATRVNITLPENVLRSADHFAETHHTTRSFLITTALLEHMSAHSDGKYCR